jgi:GxxExxY protein
MTENELSRIVLGQAIIVHRAMGPGLLESVYETCLCHRLGKTGLMIERQKPILFVFEEVKMECGFRCDVVVENKLIIEIKSVEGLNEVHFAQVLTYLKLTRIKLGLLLNFNVLQLKDGLKRVVNNL